MNPILKVMFGLLCLVSFNAMADGSPKPDFILNKPEMKGRQILLAGDNFGCGSSREHAPIAMGAAGCEAVVAESYARIFFRNCIATGELYPCEAGERLCDVVKTGDIATLDLEAATLTVGDRTWTLKPLGEVIPVVDAGGVFNYARQTGMLPAQT